MGSGWNLESRTGNYYTPPREFHNFAKLECFWFLPGPLVSALGPLVLSGVDGYYLSTSIFLVAVKSPVA